MIQACPPARTLLTLDINLAFMESVWVCGCSANGQEKLILFKKELLIIYFEDNPKPFMRDQFSPQVWCQNMRRKLINM